jgi:predicted enzyme related to lactoylglutathione lyase
MTTASAAHQVEHFVIPADRTDEIKSFYSSLFGWQFEKGETGNYWMIKNAGISGGMAPRENPEQMPTMFVSVESIDDYIGKAQQLGAKVVKNKQEISLGYYAVMEDPQKNTFRIWQGK